VTHHGLEDLSTPLGASLGLRRQFDLQLWRQQDLDYHDIYL